MMGYGDEIKHLEDSLLDEIIRQRSRVMRMIYNQSYSLKRIVDYIWVIDGRWEFEVSPSDFERQAGAFLKEVRVSEGVCERLDLVCRRVGDGYIIIELIKPECVTSACELLSRGEAYFFALVSYLGGSIGFSRPEEGKFDILFVTGSLPEIHWGHRKSLNNMGCQIFTYGDISSRVGLLYNVHLRALRGLEEFMEVFEGVLI